MKIEGVVTTVNLEVEGHSQVRIKAKVTAADGVEYDAVLIVSTPSHTLVGEFKVGGKVLLNG